MTMEELLASQPSAGMAIGDVIEGTVIAAEKHEVSLIWVPVVRVSSSVARLSSRGRLNRVT